jgi:hypothetical protein
MILPAVILFFIAAYSAGWLVSDKILKIQWRHQVPAFLVNLVLGMNFLALLVLAGGTMNVLSPAVIWTLLVILSVPGIIRSKLIIGYITAYINRNRLFTVIMCLMGIYATGSALCFPYCWDELTYHVSLPLRWIQAGGVPYLTKWKPLRKLWCTAMEWSLTRRSGLPPWATMRRPSRSA